MKTQEEEAQMVWILSSKGVSCVLLYLNLYE